MCSTNSTVAAIPRPCAAHACSSSFCSWEQLEIRIRCPEACNDLSACWPKFTGVRQNHELHLSHQLQRCWNRNQADRQEGQRSRQRRCYDAQVDEADVENPASTGARQAL